MSQLFKCSGDSNACHPDPKLHICASLPQGLLHPDLKLGQGKSPGQGCHHGKGTRNSSCGDTAQTQAWWQGWRSSKGRKTTERVTGLRPQYATCRRGHDVHRLAPSPKSWPKKLSVHTMKHHSSSRERGQATHTNAHDAPGHKKSELKNNMHKASFSRGKANHKTLLRLMGALPINTRED